jgi:hypothetical protein
VSGSVGVDDAAYTEFSGRGPIAAAKRSARQQLWITGGHWKLYGVEQGERNGRHGLHFAEPPRVFTIRALPYDFTKQFVRGGQTLPAIGMPRDGIPSSVAESRYDGSS